MVRSSEPKGKLTMPPSEIYKLAKSGKADEVLSALDCVSDVDLARVFERAVTDFRSVPRKPGHQRILEACIDAALDLDTRAGENRLSIVALAASYGNAAIVAHMESRGALPANPFSRAALGDHEFLRAMSADLADLIDDNGYNLLCYCALSALGRVDEHFAHRLIRTAELLIEVGADPGHTVETKQLRISPAFLCASHGGSVAVMRLLCAHDALDPCTIHQSLEFALEPHQRSGEPFDEIAELILESGLDINSLRPDQGRTLLHGAANRGSIKPVSWLLDHGADPNAIDDNGRTPLHVAAIRNTATRAIEILLGRGADASRVDADGRTALDHARDNKRGKVVALLEGVARDS